jgi:hypothetical protein
MNVVMNLNGIILCPFQGILDIASQITERTSLLDELVFKPISELNTISDWVNTDDSVGDPTAIRAQEMTNILCSLLNKNGISSLKIHVDLGDRLLTIDNFFALLFLSESMNHLEIFFYLSPNNITDLQCLTRTFYEKKNVVIHSRQTSRFLNESVYVKTAEQLKTKRHQLLSALGFSFDEAFHASLSNLGTIISYAWSSLKSGAYPLSCQLLESILSQDDLDSTVREEIFIHLQIIRFLSHQHHKINNEAFPEHFHCISQERIEHLYFIRAFAATLTRNLEMAEILFQKAKIHLTMTMTDEDSIYKLNLYALFLLIKGNTDTAFILENQLHDYIQSHHIHAAPLKHVVLMNIARLFKKSKHYDFANDYYKKAYYELSGGGFTQFDYINYAIDTAILSEARGQWVEALFSWVKVAICWLSCSNPYALPVRTRLVLCNEKVTETVIPLSMERVNQFLLEKINCLCVLSDTQWDNKDLPLLSFGFDEAQDTTRKTCHVTNHMVIYTSSYHKKARLSSCTPMEQTLQRLLSNLIRAHIDIGDAENIVGIETQYDCFHPQSREACVAMALLSKCASCYYNGELLHLDNHLLKNVRVTPSKMIRSIEATPTGLNVFYKRSFLNKKLESLEEIELINEISNPGIADINVLKYYRTEVLLSLFNKKIISFDFLNL